MDLERRNEISLYVKFYFIVEVLEEKLKCIGNKIYKGKKNNHFHYFFFTLLHCYLQIFYVNWNYLSGVFCRKILYIYICIYYLIPYCYLQFLLTASLIFTNFPMFLPIIMPWFARSTCKYFMLSQKIFTK